MGIEPAMTSDAGLKHQQLLAQLIRPATLSLLEKGEVKTGSKALCLNCGEGDVVFQLSGMVGEKGNVMGIDLSGENIHTARQLARIKNVTNVHFRKTHEYGREDGHPFALIHCRLPPLWYFDPEPFVEGIHSLLLPGGVAMFEVIDFSGFNSFPKNFAFERFLDLYTLIVQAQWSDTLLITRLSQLLTQSGFQRVRHEYISPTFLQGPSKHLPSLTLECIRKEVINQNLASEDELEILLCELKDFEQRSDSLISLPGIHQIWGHRAQTSSRYFQP